MSYFNKYSCLIGYIKYVIILVLLNIIQYKKLFKDI